MAIAYIPGQRYSGDGPSLILKTFSEICSSLELTCSCGEHESRLKQWKRKKSSVICGIQESKTVSVEENENSPFNRILIDRKGNKQLGMGFLVNKSLKVTSTKVNERELLH